MQKQYWGRVHTRSLAATRKLLGLESRSQIVLRALAIVVVVSALALWGSEDAATDELIFRGAAIGLVLAVFPVLYAWNFVTTPAVFDSEHIARNTALIWANHNLAAQLAHKISSGESIKTLTILMERGQDLRMKRISEDELAEWNKELDEWDVIVLKYLASKFSQQDATDFKYVQYDLARTFTYAVNDEHDRRIKVTTARIGCLKSIIDRNKEVWAPIQPQERRELEEKLEVFEQQVFAARSDQTLNKESG